MSLPDSRNRTYIDMMIVEPGDLNDLQDGIINLKLGLRAARSRKLGIATGQVVAGGPGTFNANGSFTASGGTDVLVVPLIVESGERITGLRARVDPAASGAVAVNLLRVTDGSSAVLGTPGTSSGAAVQTIAVSALTPESVADNPAVLYLASFAFTTVGGHIILAGDYTVDHL